MKECCKKINKETLEKLQSKIERNTQIAWCVINIYDAKSSIENIMTSEIKKSFDELLEKIEKLKEE